MRQMDIGDMGVDRINDLLKQAEPYCTYGSSYNRNIASAAADLRDAIEREYPEQIIESVASVLKLRYEFVTRGRDNGTQ